MEGENYNDAPQDEVVMPEGCNDYLTFEDGRHLYFYNDELDG